MHELRIRVNSILVHEPRNASFQEEMNKRFSSEGVETTNQTIFVTYSLRTSVATVFSQFLDRTFPEFSDFHCPILPKVQEVITWLDAHC